MGTGQGAGTAARAGAAAGAGTGTGPGVGAGAGTAAGAGAGPGAGLSLAAASVVRAGRDLVARLERELADALAPSGGGAAGAERAARIAWSHLVEPGDRVAGALVRGLGAAEALGLAIGREGGAVPRGRLDVPPDELASALARWRPRVDPDAIRRTAAAAARFGAVFVAPGDAEWPEALGDLGDHAPFGLWVRGSASLLRAPGAALVGARAATSYGEAAAVELAGGLGERRLATISGGAYGIDGAAHRTALAVGGPTMAVMAGGCDRLYPSGHRELLERIIAEGALVAELPLGQAPTKWRFLQRNRIVAALAGATVVVEAGVRSGALNTANHAASLGRPLGAVPGSIRSAASAGCHRLLRESDAVLVRGVDDLLELLGADDALPGLGRLPFDADPDPDAMSEEGRGPASQERDPTRRRLLDALGRGGRGRTLDELARVAGLAPSEGAAALVGLELDGLVERSDDGWRAARERGRRAS